MEPSPALGPNKERQHEDPANHAFWNPLAWELHIYTRPGARAWHGRRCAGRGAQTPGPA